MSLKEIEQSIRPVPNRRQWISQVGLCMVSAVVPPGLIACDDPIPDENSSGSDPLTSQITMWITNLEGKTIYNRQAPGKWEGIEGTHLPILTFHNENLEVTVYTNHVMNEEHSIELHYIRDQDQNLIGAKRYATDDSFARVTFPLPQGTSEIFVYSYCNLHGTWMAPGLV